MLNSVILVGRIAKDIQIQVVGPSNRKVLNLLLAVSRPFKNENGTYDTDFINVSAWQGLAELIAQNCNKGDRIGISGRVSTKPYKISDEQSITITDIIADTITYLN